MPREILRSSFREIGRLSTLPRESKENGTVVVRRERRVFAQDVPARSAANKNAHGLFLSLQDFCPRVINT
jgi:hypothetical protein